MANTPVELYSPLVDDDGEVAQAKARIEKHFNALDDENAEKQRFLATQKDIQRQVKAKVDALPEGASALTQANAASAIWAQFYLEFVKQLPEELESPPTPLRPQALKATVLSPSQVKPSLDSRAWATFAQDTGGTARDDNTIIYPEKVTAKQTGAGLTIESDEPGNMAGVTKMVTLMNELAKKGPRSMELSGGSLKEIFMACTELDKNPAITITFNQEVIDRLKAITTEASVPADADKARALLSKHAPESLQPSPISHDLTSRMQAARQGMGDPPPVLPQRKGSIASSDVEPILSTARDSVRGSLPTLGDLGDAGSAVKAIEFMVKKAKEIRGQYGEGNERNKLSESADELRTIKDKIKETNTISEEQRGKIKELSQAITSLDKTSPRPPTSSPSLD